MDPNELPSSSLLGDTSFLFEPLPLEDSEMPLLFAGQPGGVLWAPNSIATNLNSMPSSLSDQAGNVLISDSILLADNETPMSLSGPPNSVLYPFELDEPGPTNISLSLSASPDPAVHRFDWSTPGVNNMSWAMSDSSPEPPDPSDTFPMDFDSPPWCPTPGSNEEMPSVPHAGLASAESASSERLISRKDWEELQQDFGPFGTYTNNLYDPDTPQESIQFKGLKREDIIKPYGMPRGPMPTYQQNSPLTSLRPWVPPEEIFWANLHQEQTAPNIGPSNVQLPQQSAYLVTSNPSLCLSSIEPLIINHPYASMVGQQRRTETRPPTNLVPHPTRSPQAHIDPSFSLPTMNASTPIHTLAPRGTIARMKTLPPMPTQAPFNPPPILYSAPFNTPPHMVTQAPFNISAPLLTPAPLNIIGPLPQFESTNTQSPIMVTSLREPFSTANPQTESISRTPVSSCGDKPVTPKCSDAPMAQSRRRSRAKVATEIPAFQLLAPASAMIDSSPEKGYVMKVEQLEDVNWLNGDQKDNLGKAIRRKWRVLENQMYTKEHRDAVRRSLEDISRCLWKKDKEEKIKCLVPLARKALEDRRNYPEGHEIRTAATKHINLFTRTLTTSEWCFLTAMIHETTRNDLDNKSPEHDDL